MGNSSERQGFLKRHFTPSGREKARVKAVEVEKQKSTLQAEAEALTSKMAQVELFPGSKAELEELRGEPYEFVDVQNPTGFVGISGTLNREARLIQGYNAAEPFVSTRGSIYEIAVNIGADAIVNLSSTDIHQRTYHEGAGMVVFMGSPVRKAGEQEVIPGKPDTQSEPDFFKIISPEV